MNPKLARAQRILGYVFHNPGLLDTALRSDQATKNMAFQGDKIISLVLFEAIYSRGLRLESSQYSVLDALTLCNQNLRDVAVCTGLVECMHTAPTMGQTRHTWKPAADSMEAILAAVWIDAGLRHGTRDAQHEAVDKVMHRIGLMRLSLRYDHERHVWRDLETPTSRKLFPTFFSGHYLEMSREIVQERQKTEKKLFLSNYLHMVDISIKSRANILRLRDVWGDIDLDHLLNKPMDDEKPRRRRQSWWDWANSFLPEFLFRRSGWTPAAQQNVSQQDLPPLYPIYSRILARTVPLPTSQPKFSRPIPDSSRIPAEDPKPRRSLRATRTLSRTKATIVDTVVSADKTVTKTTTKSNPPTSKAEKKKAWSGKGLTPKQVKAVLRDRKKQSLERRRLEKKLKKEKEREKAKAKAQAKAQAKSKKANT